MRIPTTLLPRVILGEKNVRLDTNVSQQFPAFKYAEMLDAPTLQRVKPTVQ
jgi:hypothetical protein